MGKKKKIGNYVYLENTVQEYKTVDGKKIIFFQLLSQVKLIQLILREKLEILLIQKIE